MSSNKKIPDLNHLLNASKNLKDDAEAGEFAELEEDIDFIRAIGLSFVEPDDDADMSVFVQHGSNVSAKLDEYRASHIKLGNLGILGPEARSKGKGSYVTASALVTKEALELGHEVTREDLKQFYTDDEQKDLFQVPSVYYVSPPEDATKMNKQRWRFIHGPESARVQLDGGASFVPVVLVALTPMVVHFVPHSEKQFTAWEELTVGGKHAPDLKGKLSSTTLSSDFSTRLHQDRADYTLKMEMMPGSRIITHRGMPLFLSATQQDEEKQEEDEDHITDGLFVAKTVVAELRQSDDEAMQKTLSKRHLTWRMALDKGGWNSPKIDSNISANIISKITKVPSEPLFEATPYQEMIECLAMTTLVRSPKGQLPKDPEEIKRKKAEAAKKKAAKEKEKEEEDDDDDGSAQPMDIDPEDNAKEDEENPKSKRTSSFKPKKKKKKQQQQKQQTAPTKDTEAPESKKKKKKKEKSNSPAKIKPEEVLYKQHDELMERISNIDPDAWNPDFSKAAKGHRSALQNDSTSPEAKAFIKKYRASLKTLTKKAEQAEKDQTGVLPVISKQMTEAREILDNLEIKTDNKKIKTSHASRLKDLETLSSSYLMRSGKKVELFLKDCQRLQKSVKDDLDRKRKREEESKSKGSVSLEIPVINDDDDIDEMLCTGSAEIQNTFKQWQGKTDAFRNMIMALGNDQATNLFDVWEKAKQDVIEYVQAYMKEHQKDDPKADNAVYDMGKLNTYGHALQHVFDTRGSGKSINGGKKRKATNKARKIECPHCEEMMKEFEDTGYCKPCFRKFGLRELTLGLERRAKKLEALADAETTAIVEAEDEARKALREAGENSDDVEEKPLGPYQQAWDIWDGYPESPEGDAAVLGLYHRLTKQAEIFDGNKRANNWSELHALIQEADALLPHLTADEDEEYNSADMEDEEDDEDIMEWAVADDEPIEYMSDHEEEEEEEDEAIMPTPKKSKSTTKRKRAREAEKKKKKNCTASTNGHNDQAHAVLMALKRYKFAETRESLLNHYPDHPDEVDIELERLSNIKTAYVIDMQWEGDDDVTTFPDYFTSIKEAISKIKELTVPGLSCKPRKINLE